jgi:hypothetical protein
MSGSVVDMAGSGLRLWLPKPLPCGSSVKVESQQAVIVGEVARCEENGDGYNVGLTLLHTAT